MCISELFGRIMLHKMTLLIDEPQVVGCAYHFLWPMYKHAAHIKTL